MSTANNVTCSIIIPVYNEEQHINSLINQVFNPACEIIVVDGNPTANTLQAITHPDVIKITSPAGRGIQLNAGAQKAKGAILFFIHADSTPSNYAIETIRNILQDESIVGGAFQLHIDSLKKSYRFLEWCINLRSRITQVPYGDQGIFIKKTCFEELGGFPSYPIMEDIAFIKKIKKQRLRFSLLKETIATSPRRWEQEGIIRCTLRNWMIRTLYYLGVHPEKLQKWYR